MPATKAANTISNDKNTYLGDRASSRNKVNILDRVLPHNIDAEEGLIASCILDSGQEVVSWCMESHITAESFYKPVHQIIYQAIVDLFNTGSGVDEIILCDHLQNKKQLDEIGGYSTVTRISNRIETTAHAKYWLEIVREKYMTRRLISTSTGIIDKCYHSEDSLDHLLESVEQEIFQISQDRVSDFAQQIEKPIDSAVNIVNSMLQRKGELTGVPSGFTDLDRMTFGFHRQEMIVLAARPSMGKTSLAMNIAEFAVLNNRSNAQPIPTLVFSLEMSSEQLALRLLCCRSRVNMQRLKEGFIPKQGGGKALAKAAKELKGAPLWIDDSGHLTILELRAKARRLKSKVDIGLIVIDYLQLISGTDNRTGREQQISEISRGIKAMAKELNVPIIVLSQLNRESEREKRAPRLSDLRESGSIEQDADVVLLLAKRGEKDEGSQSSYDSSTRDLIIAKQRNGPVGDVTLTFITEYTRFENYTQHKTD